MHEGPVNKEATQPLRVSLINKDITQFDSSFYVQSLIGRGDFVHAQPGILMREKHYRRHLRQEVMGKWGKPCMFAITTVMGILSQGSWILPP